jgi:hypothetical protein
MDSDTCTEKNATQIYAANRRDIEDDMAENAEEFPEIGIEELMEELDINDDNGECSLYMYSLTLL